MCIRDRKSNFINRTEVRAKRASIVSCLSELFRSCHGVTMALPCGLRQWAFATLEIDTGYPTFKGNWVEMVLKLSQHMKENMTYKCNFWSWFGQHQPPGRRGRNFLVYPAVLCPQGLEWQPIPYLRISIWQSTKWKIQCVVCLLYTSPSPRDA